MSVAQLCKSIRQPEVWGGMSSTCTRCRRAGPERHSVQRL